MGTLHIHPANENLAALYPGVADLNRAGVALM